MFNVISQLAAKPSYCYSALNNRWMLSKNKVTYETFPKIYGRILIVKLADGSIKLGRNVIFNSSFESGLIGGTRSVLAILKENASIEIGDGAGLSNVIIAAHNSIQIGCNVNIGGGTKIF